MSWLRLLSTGKSLIGIRERKTRYQLNRERVLPEFCARKNPFRDAAPASGGRVDVRPVPSAGLGAAGSAAAPASEVVPGLLRRLCNFSWRRAGKRPKPAVPRFGHGPIQTELSLDKIKVMRNDLSDTDVEVVQAPQRPVPAGGAAAVSMARPAVPANAWQRVTGLFGVGKM